LRASDAGVAALPTGVRFTGFAGTRVQILTAEELRARATTAATPPRMLTYADVWQGDDSSDAGTCATRALDVAAAVAAVAAPPSAAGEEEPLGANWNASSSCGACGSNPEGMRVRLLRTLFKRCSDKVLPPVLATK